jgi:DNA-binding beta-propeller fold protein YncE
MGLSARRLLVVTVVGTAVIAAAVVAWSVRSSTPTTRYPHGSAKSVASPSPPPRTPTSGRPPTAPPADRVPWASALPADVAGHLRPGSDPSVLPTDLLIADKLNNRLIVVDPQGRVRWQFPRPGDLLGGQTFRIPDDAFFSPDGRFIIATQEDQAVISVISVALHRIVYRYGVPGRPGMSADRLDNPDDAMMLPNGDIFTADIKNCRLLLIAPGSHRPLRVFGLTTHACVHAPPRHWGSPNGVFPESDGHYLVTEINGDWVDDMGPGGRIYWTTHPAGIAYPSDTNEIGPNRYLTVDYSSPGRVSIFNRAGHTLWTFTGRGRNALDHPSLALPLPNGDVVLNDDYNHRVIVVDPRTSRIVWQYGVTGAAGRKAGYLDNPDGIDLVPPRSLVIVHAAAMRAHPVSRR